MKPIMKTKITAEYADCDFMDKLNHQDAEWYQKFTQEYYCHPSQSQIEIHPKEQGTELRRTHRQRSRDVLSRFSSDLNENVPAQNLDPEAELILHEEVTKRLRTKIKKKANKI